MVSNINANITSSTLTLPSLNKNNKDNSRHNQYKNKMVSNINANITSSTLTLPNLNKNNKDNNRHNQ